MNKLKKEIFKFIGYPVIHTPNDEETSYRSSCCGAAILPKEERPGAINFYILNKCPKCGNKIDWDRRAKEVYK